MSFDLFELKLMIELLYKERVNKSQALDVRISHLIQKLETMKIDMEEGEE